MMTTGPTGYDLFAEAKRLWHHARAVSRSGPLDEKTSMWVIRMEAWREMRLCDDHRYLDMHRRNQLLGLPVRLTIDDEPDVPMLQLVMEPLVWAL
jgi:hypothetical protein